MQFLERESEDRAKFIASLCCTHRTNTTLCVKYIYIKLSNPISAKSQDQAVGGSWVALNP